MSHTDARGPSPLTLRTLASPRTATVFIIILLMVMLMFFSPNRNRTRGAQSNVDEGIAVVELITDPSRRQQPAAITPGESIGPVTFGLPTLPLKPRMPIEGPSPALRRRTDVPDNAVDRQEDVVEPSALTQGKKSPRSAERLPVRKWWCRAPTTVVNESEGVPPVDPRRDGYPLALLPEGAYEGINTTQPWTHWRWFVDTNGSTTPPGKQPMLKIKRTERKGARRAQSEWRNPVRAKVLVDKEWVPTSPNRVYEPLVRIMDSSGLDDLEGLAERLLADVWVGPEQGQFRRWRWVPSADGARTLQVDMPMLLVFIGDSHLRDIFDVFCHFIARTLAARGAGTSTSDCIVSKKNPIASLKQRHPYERVLMTYNDYVDVARSTFGPLALGFADMWRYHLLQPDGDARENPPNTVFNEWGRTSGKDTDQHANRTNRHLHVVHHVDLVTSRGTHEMAHHNQDPSWALKDYLEDLQGFMQQFILGRLGKELQTPTGKKHSDVWSSAQRELASVASGSLVIVSLRSNTVMYAMHSYYAPEGYEDVADWQCTHPARQEIYRDLTYCAAAALNDVMEGAANGTGGGAASVAAVRPAIPLTMTTTVFDVVALTATRHAKMRSDGHHYKAEALDSITLAFALHWFGIHKNFAAVAPLKRPMEVLPYRAYLNSYWRHVVIPEHRRLLAAPPQGMRDLSDGISDPRYNASMWQCVCFGSGHMKRTPKCRGMMALFRIVWAKEAAKAAEAKLNESTAWGNVDAANAGDIVLDGPIPTPDATPTGDLRSV